MDPKKRAHRALSVAVYIAVVFFYLLFAYAYYKRPYRFVSRLFQDLLVVRQSVLSKTSFSNLLPSKLLLSGYENFKRRAAYSEGQHPLKRALYLETHSAGFFSFYVPYLLWIRFVYLGFFLIPPMLLWFAYLARLWHLKMSQTFITHWIYQAGAELAAALLKFAFLIFLLFPAAPPYLCVWAAWMWPPVHFAKEYYSGAWLWRKREV